MKLRDYQEEFNRRLFDNYDRGIRANLGVLATGLGKTVLADFAQQEFRKRTGKKCLFLVDQIDLAHQTAASFIKNNPDIKIDIEMGELRSHKSADIVIASVPSLGKLGSERIKRFNPNDFGFICCDESHRAVSPIWQNVLRYFGAHPDYFEEGKLLLGLTATPNREDGVALGYLFDDIIGPYDITYGIKNGWLTEIDWYPVDTHLDISGASFTEEGLLAATQDATRMLLPVKAYKQICPHESAIVYCGSVERAEHIAGLFNENGVSAFCIHAETIPEIRKQKLEDFRDGTLKVLTNYNTLSTGVDAPDTSAIIFERVIGSQLLYTQCVGRGLRPASATFIDHYTSANDRKDAIKNSIKPATKVIDLCDNVGNHSVCSVPMLFGLPPEFNKKKTETFFKEVVEVIDEVVLKHPIDKNKIASLDDIHLVVSTERLKMDVYDFSEEVTSMSDFEWFKINEDTYRTEFPFNHASIIVKKNLLDNYEVMLYDNEKRITKKLNEFSSIAGAVNIAEKYAKSELNTSIAKKEAVWKNEPITGSQYYLLWRFNRWNKKWKFSKEKNELGIPRIFKDGIELFRGDASKELSKKFKK